VRGDLGIRGGAIVAVGKVEGDAGQVIDADGLAVAPGFERDRYLALALPPRPHES